jgi:hypothetical protein
MKDAAGSPSIPHYHAVRFYESANALAQMVSEFLADGIVKDHPAIVVATPAHRAAILRELMKRDVDVVQLQLSGDLLLLDAAETLATFMIGGRPHAAMFKTVMCDAIARVCGDRTDCRVRVYGEMVDVLWQKGQQDAAIRLEILWNDLADTHAFSLLCGYAMGHFLKDARMDDVCAQHTHVVGPDGTTKAVA